MEESLNLSLRAREIIVSPSHEDLAMIVDHLFMRQDSEEYKTSRALYDLWVSGFQDCLALKLLKVYLSSSNGVTRFRSIYQLSETLTDLRNRKFKLSLDSLHEIKRVLIACLTMQETKESDIKILRKIVSCVAYNVLELHKDKWDELGDCILTLAESEPRKAFHVFIDLPPVYDDFIKKFLTIMLGKVKEVLDNLDQSGVEDWSLALQTLVKLDIQCFNTGMKRYVIKRIMRSQLMNIPKSAKKLVENEKEKFLVRGLEDFERFLSRDMTLYKYTEENCHFVSAFMSRIEKVREVGTQTKEIVRKINMLITKLDHPSLIQPGVEYDRDWYDHLKNLSSLEVLEIFASTDLEDRSREMAIRRLNGLLSHHTSGKVKIDIAKMKELQPLLISCLEEEGISDDMFKVLGQVVNHVANEMFVYQKETWYDLLNYVVSQSKTKFERAAYIFQCLTMAFVEYESVNHVLKELLPEINTRLNPPTELLVDNSYWVLAFTGAFCAIIHLISHDTSFKEIAHNMINSVRKLVERGMEVGLVRRAFRDVETIVKKQVGLYDGKREYKFLKVLLWKLYAIKGMTWESKIVLWRINVIVERGVKEVKKELQENECV